MVGGALQAQGWVVLAEVVKFLTREPDQGRDLQQQLIVEVGEGHKFNLQSNPKSVLFLCNCISPIIKSAVTKNSLC